MSQDEDKKYFSWGCSIPIDSKGGGFPTSRTISHVRNCACPDGNDEDGLRMVILEAAHRLHESNVVRFRIPVANALAREAADRIGVSLRLRLEDLPPYENKVFWGGSVCTEIIGRGFTPDEFEYLNRLEKKEIQCEWLI